MACHVYDYSLPPRYKAPKGNETKKPLGTASRNLLKYMGGDRHTTEHGAREGEWVQLTAEPNAYVCRTLVQAPMSRA